MELLFQRLCSKKLLPISWTVITIVLLCLPGSTIPGDGFGFNIPNFDKIVHVILFGGIVLFWGGHYAFRAKKLPGWRRMIILLAILSIVLGIVLEYVQFYWIPQRSFDRGDIVADAGGAITAMLFLLFLYPARRVKH